MQQEKEGYTEFPPNPLERANFLSKLSFAWTLPLFRKGLKKDLEPPDLYATLNKDMSEKLGNSLQKNYEDLLRKEKSGQYPRLYHALFKTFWRELLCLGLLCFINEVFIKLTSPVLVGRLLDFFRLGSTTSREEALWCAGGIVMLSGLNAVAMNHFVISSFHMGMRMRVAVCSLVYRKSLRLSRTALGESAPGKVVNLLSNDVNRFDVASVFLHFLWVAPITAFVVLYLLWAEIGLSGLLGVLVVFTVMPIQAYTGKLSAVYRLQTALKTDERVRLMGEIISGIQVIKMYAWEKPFMALVALARKLEIDVVRKVSYVRGVYMTFLLTTTRLAIFCVMLSLVLTHYELTASKVFVVAMYFNLLAHTMSAMFVRAIAETAEAFVALQRVEKFLQHDEFKDSRTDFSENHHDNHDTVAQTNLKNSHSEKAEKLVTKPFIEHNKPSKPLYTDDNKLKTYNPLMQENDTKYAIRLLKAEARWLPESLEPSLFIENLDIEQGKLVAIIGLVGSGKTSLLQALLGEIVLSTGWLQIQGSLSYACQEPWVFGASVRQNILFGQPYEKRRYDEVVRVCALQPDFRQFPFGDQTLVGERGTSLSGGQKARINLARTIYRRCEIYLLDDPLSAVDSHVGKHLFQQCVLGYLRRKTRILVTHQLHHLKDADHIVMLKDGKIEMQGSFEDVSRSSLEYARLLTPEDAPSSASTENQQKKEEVKDEEDDLVEKLSQRHLMVKDGLLEQRNRSGSICSSVVDLADLSSGMEAERERSEDRLTQHKQQTAEPESTSKGSVVGSVFRQYLQAGGNICLLLFVISAFLITQALVMAADFWMSYWTAQEEKRRYYNFLESNFTELTANHSSIVSEIDLEKDDLLSTDACIYIHGGIVLGLFLMAFIRSISFYTVCMHASQKLHDLMFAGVIHSPMIFFNTTPSGRILNRFSKDMGTTDELLPKAILDAGQVTLQMVGSVMLACYVNPYFLLPIMLLLCLFMLIKNAYLKTSKSIKRLEGAARSPVFTHLNTTMQGLPTVRAYGAQEILTKEFDNYQDVHTSAWYMFIATSSAFGMMLDVFCFILVGCVTFSFLVVDTGVLGDQVGLAITQCMSLTFMLQWGIRQVAEVANQLMAVERLLQYTQLTAEEDVPAIGSSPSKSLGGSRLNRLPPRDWPEQGALQLKDLRLRYDLAQPYVLRGVYCNIEPNEKVGIVGRTGAGKSSLIAALFRLAYLEGAIVIDGVDTQDISLQDLRKKISIIPQDPVLFSGTVRRNLDPFEEYSDDALWQALDEVELKDALGPAGLQSHVQDGGANYSVGQRQLVCLARAILRNNKILMLDEATANVDPQTDNLIQRTIRTKFESCTVLTVAHRLNTIMDSDKVLVMESGRMVEFDHPHILLLNKNSFLSKMAAETGPQNAAVLTHQAETAYMFKQLKDQSRIKMIDDE